MTPVPHATSHDDHDSQSPHAQVVVGVTGGGVGVGVGGGVTGVGVGVGVGGGAQDPELQ